MVEPQEVNVNQNSLNAQGGSATQTINNLTPNPVGGRGDVLGISAVPGKPKRPILMASLVFFAVLLLVSGFFTARGLSRLGGAPNEEGTSSASQNGGVIPNGSAGGNATEAVAENTRPNGPPLIDDEGGFSPIVDYTATTTTGLTPGRESSTPSEGFASIDGINFLISNLDCSKDTIDLEVEAISGTSSSTTFFVDEGMVSLIFNETKELASPNKEEFSLDISAEDFNVEDIRVEMGVIDSTGAYSMLDSWLCNA